MKQKSTTPSSTSAEAPAATGEPLRPFREPRLVLDSSGGWFGRWRATGLEPELLAKETANVLKNLPDALELANLGATLAQGQKVDGETAKEYARQALILFEACHAHLESEATRRAEFGIADRWRDDQDAKIPLPKAFPASLNDFLRACLKKQLCEFVRSCGNWSRKCA